MKSKSLRQIPRCFVAIATALLFVGTSMAIESQTNDIKTTIPETLTRGTYTFNPTDDSFIGAEGEVNGLLPEMGLRNGGSGGYWAASPVIKFDVSSLPQQTSTLIVSAELYIYYFYQADNDPTGNPLVLYRFLDDWKEETITKGAMPAYENEQSAMTPAPGSIGVWISWNVTEDIQSFVSGSLINYGWILKDEHYWGGPNIPLMYLYSKEQGNNIPYLEVVINEPPSAPEIIGQINGSEGQSYNYNFVASDPEGQQIYYYIDWGDGQTIDWIGPYPSGTPQSFIHSWSERGTYIIQAKAKDIFGAESDWGTLTVTMPYSSAIPFQQFWERFFEQFPNAFPILRHLVGY